MGGSGTGKSVLIKHMVGPLKPDAGRLFVDGEDITTMNEDQLFAVQKRFEITSFRARRCSIRSRWERTSRSASRTSGRT